ncbi:hypothetical protein Ana3638_22135 [Anaerocolumna sedimenticola]|uniref:Uroporphyrinogen decarboxylase (URO-D) domain-containing protein n=1 Tax=Anaerocolumna sedimenticola TaxID=2696063 RepID=A0A6P1TPE6_9FIRM|nr:hypothetical protein [Anaerocolumna sedimenticola]QHQ63140.1 hypothetical protein Ana3638_22135 [Anaerocolumna sedimenticola]
MTHDEQILRKLSREFAVAANDDMNLKRKELHKAVVDLHMVRPVILIDELPWNELNQNGELTLQCEDPYLKSVERYIRQTLYKWKYIPGDMIIPPFIGVSKVIHTTGIGLQINEETVSTNSENNIVSHKFIDQMEDESCLELLHNEVITYDKEESERRYNLIANMIGDIIPVKLTGNRWVFDTLWDDVAQLHGVENTLIDLLVRPEYMHDIAEKLTSIFIDKVRQYEELNLFEGYQDTVHSTTAYSDDLPSKNFDGTHFKAKDVWGRGAAQVFASASPEARNEFDIPYMCRAMEQFGLVYYGCCEPLHNQIDIVSKIPNLRKISVTPWADFDIAAECIGKKYVMAAKANPAAVAIPNVDEGLYAVN